MKKAAFVALAAGCGLVQYGCLMGVHDIGVHLLGIGWTLDLLNIVP